MSKRRHRFYYANQIAEQLVPALEDACERIMVAGSLRRRPALVGDIEIVAVAKRTDSLLANDGDDGGYSLLEARIQRLLNEGTPFAEAVKNGRRYKQLRIACPPADEKKPIVLDLFIVAADAWGVQLALRTGPAPFSKALVTPRAQGGRLADGYTIADGGHLFRGRMVHEGTVVRNGERVPMTDEREFLEAYAGGWVPPENRR